MYLKILFQNSIDRSHLKTFKMSQFNFAISKHETKILKIINAFKTIIIEAPTGTGKTLGIPHMIAKRTQKQVLVTVNNDLTERKSTAMKALDNIQYINIQTLVTNILNDRNIIKNLSPFIVIDEFHSSTVWVSAFLGILKHYFGGDQYRGPKLIFTTATPITSDVKLYFPEIKKLNIAEMAFDVEVFYEEDFFNPLTAGEDAINSKILEKVLIEQGKQGKQGGLGIIFRPGVKEIKNTIAFLKSALPPKTAFYSIYSGLKANELDRIFYEITNTPDVFKLIVATNYIESSVTIKDADFIISDMLEKRFIKNQFELGLIPERAALQRKGRVGRTKPGRAYFLIDRESFKQLPLFKSRDVETTQINNIVLLLIDAGLDPKEILLLTSEVYFNVESELIDNGLIKDGKITKEGIFAKYFNYDPLNIKFIFKMMKFNTMTDYFTSKTALAVVVFLENYRSQIFMPNYRWRHKNLVSEFIYLFWDFIKFTVESKTIKNIDPWTSDQINIKLWKNLFSQFLYLNKFILMNNPEYRQFENKYIMCKPELFMEIEYNILQGYRETYRRMVKIGKFYFADGDYYILNNNLKTKAEIIYVSNIFIIGSKKIINILVPGKEDEVGYLELSQDKDEKFLQEILN